MRPLKKKSKFRVSMDIISFNQGVYRKLKRNDIEVFRERLILRLLTWVENRKLQQKNSLDKFL